MINQHPVSELRGKFQINCATGLGGGGGSVTKNLPSSVCAEKRYIAHL